MNNLKYKIISYGCQMNDLDSEMIAGLVEEMNYQSTEDEHNADLIIMNTCCVRQTAEQRAIGRLTKLKPLKSKNPDLIIVFAGCIAQKDKETIFKRFPFVDIVIGTRDIQFLPQYIQQTLSNRKPICRTHHIVDNHFILTTPKRKHKIKALVTIMFGCNNFCSYCIVPYVRGREVSRPANEIVDEIKKLADEGYKEVTLIGQNVNSYIYDNVNFPKPLELVNNKTDIQRIRFITSHPKDVSDELISAMRNLPKVCEHIHLPAQAGSNKILKLMNRAYTREKYIELFEKFKNNIPNTAITTDMIMGFPGETEEDFQQTMDLLEKVRWDMSFSFVYSIRNGTGAAELNDDVPYELKKSRLNRYNELQDKISLEKNQLLVNQSVEVLVEGVSKKRTYEMMGRTRTDKVVIFKGNESQIGSIINVRIEKSAMHTLFGEDAEQSKQGN